MTESDPASELAQTLGTTVLRWLGCSLEEAGVLPAVTVHDGRATVALKLGLPVRHRHAEVLQALEARLHESGAQSTVLDLELDWAVRPHAAQGTIAPIAGVRNVLAVASGKGGVGKSTTAVNLALALAAEGAAVGILDADIYGPSVPRMLGLAGQRPQSEDGRTIQPLRAHGIAAMSIGFLVDDEQPMAWRGPMVTQALNQLLTQTQWGELDYLVVDMPPGTGDIQLTLSQKVPVSGAVIVTTPQEIATADARKGLQMFRKVNVNVLGIVENMSTHICSNCGHEEHVFGAGGGQRIAEQYDVPLLGSLPLDLRIREHADGGTPSVVADPDGALAGAYRETALNVAGRLSVSARSYAHRFPNIVVEDS